MFRCRSFPGQYLLLTVEQREGRLDQMAACSRNFWCKHSPVVTDRGYFRAVRLRPAAGRNADRVAHPPAMRCTTNSPAVMRDGSFEGRRFESCHSQRAV